MRKKGQADVRNREGQCALGGCRERRNRPARDSSPPLMQLNSQGEAGRLPQTQRPAIIHTNSPRQVGGGGGCAPGKAWLVVGGDGRGLNPEQ